MDTIKASLQNTGEKGLHEHGIVATLCDESHFHLVFDQRLDADMQPELGDFSLVAGGQQVELVSLSLKSGIKQGESWSLISFGLQKAIKPGTLFQLNYHPRHFFLWSEERDEPIDGFELRAIVADLNVLKALDLRVNAAPWEKEVSGTKIKADARIVEVCDRQIRIELNHVFEVGLNPKIEDFRAESDTRYLNIDRIYVTPVKAHVELSLLLHQEVEANSRVKVTYKPGKRPMRTQAGELLESFRVDAIATAHYFDTLENDENCDVTLDDIDQLLDLAKNGGTVKPRKDSNAKKSSASKKDSNPKKEKSNTPVESSKPSESSESLEESITAEESNVVLLFAGHKEEEETEALDTAKAVAPETNFIEPDSAEDVASQPIEAVEPAAEEPQKEQPAKEEPLNEELAVKASVIQEPEIVDREENTTLATEVAEPIIEKPLIKRVAQHIPSQPIQAQQVVAKSVSEPGEQRPETSDVSVEEQAEIHAEKEKISLYQKILQTDPKMLFAAAVGAAFGGWALFAVINFFALIFSFDALNEPQPSLIEKLASQAAEPSQNANPAQKSDGPQACELSYEDGSQFKGSCLNGLRDGGGNYIYANGDKYMGEWANDLRHGNGMFQKQNGEIYAGGFINGKKQGGGSYSWPDGSIYQGEFQNDKFHGQGSLKEADGRIFEGRFEDGRPIDGVCISPDGIKIRGPC